MRSVAEEKGRVRPTLEDIEKQYTQTQREAAAGDKAAVRRLPAMRKRVESARQIAAVSAHTPVQQEGVELTAWERYQLASNKNRPLSLDYIQALFTEFTEIHGDRQFGDDRAVICGTARFEGRSCVVVGQQKGRDVQERLMRNFGMMHPEGYRKALRTMKLASKFGMPIFVFIDTKGAFPGLGAEERGQAEAIARNIREMFSIETPIIVTVVGEGASGGALGIGVGDRVLMMENSWYNVISPEGCAAILWNDPAMAPRAAEALKLSAPEVLKLGVVDEIVEEPNGGAHRDAGAAIGKLREALRRHVGHLCGLSREALGAERFGKFRKIGVYREA